MRRLFLLSIFTCFILSISNAQDDNEQVFTKVEIESGPDRKQWIEHLKKYTPMPDSVSKNIPAGTYKISVQFVIDKMGNIGDIKALNDPGYGLARKAEKVVSSYKGEWKPAVQCGRYVKAYRKETIIFTIIDTPPSL